LKDGPSERDLPRRAARRLLPYVARQSTTLLVVLALGLLTALAAKAPIALLEPVVNVVFEEKPLGGIAADRIPLLGSALRDVNDFVLGRLSPGTGQGKGAEALLVAVTLLAVGIALVGAIAEYLFSVLSRRIGLRLTVDLRRDLCERLLRLPLRAHVSRRLGDLLSRTNNDIQVSLRAFTLLFDDVVQEPFMILASLALMFAVSPGLTAVFLAMIPLVALPVVLFGRRIRRGSRRSLEALGETTESLAQSLAGIRVVKSFNMEASEVREFEAANRRFLRRSMSMARAKAGSSAALILLTGAGTAFLVLVLGWLKLRHGMFTTSGSLLAFLAPLGTLYAHTKRVTKAYTVVQESMGATGRVLELLELEPERADAPDARSIERVREGIEVKDLTFAYDAEEVLTGVSFRAKAGETIAIVGPSGAGKSTLVDLLAGFHEPKAGGILVDGVDLRRIARPSWLRQIAVVAQDPFVFHTSVRENLCYGKPEAAEAEMVEAARAANAHDFVASLPQGYDTLVGEAGARLSGGQLQRITIARAILKDPSVLLLDEATSSLDTESEAAVQSALANLRKGRTTFVIAHRLSTVRDADRILVLDGGRIAEQGTHAELMARGGLYRRLFDRQFSTLVA
jgi:ATP-binding cassette, subfamily B, bacterial MsbA